ncbi:hypothetical protein DL769_002272 [Monosporascus sp. CRB-8-3]|nr:hypothetical protein DL769_002272 [Monosporascus sp. CRB-8-3]
MKVGDDSNVSIGQIMLAGFTPDRCLIYDHLFRREALDGLRHYPSDILRVQEQFTWDLRKNMSAAVDICWEAMLHANRSTMGKLQDLHLSVAARLGGITIDKHFYETNHRQGTYGRLLKVEWARQKALNEEAIAQVFSCARETAGGATGSLFKQSQPGSLGTVFPGILCNPALVDAAEDNGSDEIPSEEESPVAKSQIDSASVVEILPEVDVAVKGPQGLKCLISSLVDSSFSVGDAVSLLSVSESDEFSAFGELSWEDVPLRLRSWLEEQEGLRIDKHPISSTAELLKVHQLLCRKTRGFQSYGDINITSVIIDVALRYFKQIEPVQRTSTIADLTVSGKHPVPRKCGACGSRVLDDAFPRFKKLDPTKYVVRYLKSGCGIENCQPKWISAWAIPVDDKTPWCKPDRGDLKRPPQRAAWADVLLRTKENAAGLGLPSTVQCICRGCEENITTDEDPRWTVELLPRYLPRRPLCVTCDNTCTNRRPVDPSIKWLDAAVVSKKWAQIRKEGWVIEDILKNPDRCFPKPRELMGKNRKVRQSANVRPNWG